MPSTQQATSVEALNWIAESALSDEQKKLQSAFVNRFSDVTYFRYLPEFWPGFMQEAPVQLPAWFTTQMSVFAGPVQPVLLGLPADDPETADPTDPFKYYSPALIGHNADDIKLWQGESTVLWPIASRDERPEVQMAINLSDPTDQKIYGYNRQYLSDMASEGNPLSHEYTDWFPSLAHFWSEVRRVKK